MTRVRTTLNRTIKDKVISIDERDLDLHDLVLRHERTVLDTSDQMVHDGLVSLGWTPPHGKSPAHTLLLSLWNDEGLRALLRPDQVRRIEEFLKDNP